MKFLRHVAIDIIITIFIIIVVIVKSTSLDITLAIITVLLLLARLSLLGNKALGKQLSKKQTGVPEWFYHVLNGANVVLLLIGQLWLLAAAWGVIWYLSWKTLRAAQASAANRKRKR
jgi:hypothetical protein